MNLRLEFHTVRNGGSVRWRLLNEVGTVLARSEERWPNLKTAKQRTGEVLVELFRNQFEVFDLINQTKPRKRKTKK